MALYHFHADIVTRSAGSSIVASAAYRAGEKLHSEYYGEDADYTKKGGVLYTEIFLPTYAPSEYKDRETLWNAVEKVEKNQKAQLAYTTLSSTRWTCPKSEPTTSGAALTPDMVG